MSACAQDTVEIPAATIKHQNLEKHTDITIFTVIIPKIYTVINTKIENEISKLHKYFITQIE